jgi:hypothetical protein
MELWRRFDPPAHIVASQQVYDRSYMTWRMSQCGFTHRQIALRLHVSEGRAGQLIRRFERHRRRLSPIERWIKNTVPELARTYPIVK